MRALQAVCTGRRRYPNRHSQIACRQGYVIPPIVALSWPGSRQGAGLVNYGMVNYWNCSVYFKLVFFYLFKLYVSAQNEMNYRQTPHILFFINSEVLNYLII